MRKILIIIFLSLVFSFQAQAQVLGAKVNRNPVPQGEAFVLSLTLENGKTNMQPDVTILEKDFEVYSVSTSTSIQIINGTRAENQQWNIGLIARQAGDLTIPAITLGNITSRPISIKVLDANQILQNSSSASGRTENAPRFSMKAEVSSRDPYVQQQILYTATIFDTGGLVLAQEPQFTAANQNDWVIKSIAAPEVNSKVINGKAIREIKFQYALFPQKSGNLKTPELRLNGFYLTKGKRGYDPFEQLFNDGFSGNFGFADMFATRNPVALNAEAISLTVHPIPAANNGNWWLPAESVELYAEWEPKNPVFKAGEAVNRTIYLQAVGAADNQLPDIKFGKTSGIKQYPEKAETEMRADNGKIISIKRAVNVYIPEKEGKATIPAIEIPWFDTRSQKMAKAILPEMTVNILPGVATSNTAPQQLAEVPATMGERAENLEQAAAETEAFVQQQVPNFKLYLWIALAFGLGIGLSYFLFRPKCVSNSNHTEIKDYKKFIISKAKSKDFRSLRDALIEWAAAENPGEKVNNLKDLVRLYPEMEPQLDLLMAELYGKEDAAWNSSEFVAAFNQIYKKRNKHKQQSDVLPKLYKN